jgi:hypothetical protein
MIYLGNFLKYMNRYIYCSNLYVYYLCIWNLYTTNIIDGGKRVSWGSPVWSPISPQGALKRGRPSSQYVLKGEADTRATEAFGLILTGSVSDGFEIRLVQNQIASESDRFGIR